MLTYLVDQQPPSIPRPRSAPLTTIDAFFTKPAPSKQARSSTPLADRPNQPAADSSLVASRDLRATLPLPLNSRLSRSQLLFSAHTSINPLALQIDSDSKNEWFTYMDLRAQHQWVSHSMTPRKWVQATILYNTELRRRNLEEGFNTIEKHPRALMNKLPDIEKKISERLQGNNFKCMCYHLLC